MVSWFAVFKYLHVAFAIVWVGGGLGLVILGARAYRANNNADFTQVLLNVVYMSTHVFIPSALISLVFGILSAWSGWSFDWLWIWLGLIGFAATFALGGLVLGPRSGKVSALIAQGGVTPEVMKQGSEILKIAQFDMVLLFVVVADMVLKPGWANWITLIVMVLVLAGAGYYFLSDILRPVIDAQMKAIRKI